MGYKPTTVKSNKHIINSFHVPFICFKTVSCFTIFTARVSSAGGRHIELFASALWHRLRVRTATVLLLLLLLFLLGTRAWWTEDLGKWRTTVVSWLVVVAERCVVRTTSTSWPGSHLFFTVVHVSRLCPAPYFTHLHTSTTTSRYMFTNVSHKLVLPDHSTQFTIRSIPRR